MQNRVRVEALAEFRDKTGVPAVFGGVINADGILGLNAVGVRRRGHPEAVTASDQVHIGSCCKMVTAALFGTFVAENRVDWEMPITELFPDLADSMATGWQQQTVEGLCCCLSGMVANPPRQLLTSGYTDARSLPQQRTELTRLAFSKPPHKPGGFVYSNMSYIVMGAAIDRLCGNSFESALKSRILEPLAINSAGYGPPPKVWGHAPKVFLGGLALFKGKPANPSNRKSDNPPSLSSAGTLHLHCADWAKLLRLFLVKSNLGIIEDRIIERILRVPQNKAARMSMGWAPVQLDGVGYGAQGSNVYWSATALMDDDRRRIALVACNDGRSRVLRQSIFLAHRLLAM
ncbi:MAG: serine hydrolase domain-containing protein [Burkholderiaceae bacterium]